jgi:uncharacterized protein YdeI (YjbR/CyaY-like superfamily)
MAAKAKSFDATLVRGGGTLNWTIIRIPFDSAKLWRTRGQIRVKGDINGFPFTSTLFPDGEGSHILVVNKTMQKGSKTKLGSTAKFRLEPDTTKREIEIPEQLEAILNEDRALRKFFDSFSDSNRRMIGKWITDPKSDDARARRADQFAERAIATMEAERDLPPALKAAFANDPIAHEQWKKVPASHRRQHLLAIFGYRDPASRAKRVRKMLDELRSRKLN